MKKLCLYAAITAVMLYAAPAAAHFIWLNIGQEQTHLNRPLPITVGWGHHFPKSEKFDPAQIKTVKAMGPAGRAVGLTKKSPVKYELKPDQAGAYLVLAACEPGFVTKTTEGYKRQSKKGLKEALSCFQYDLRTKALIPVKGAAGGERRVGDILEITPLQDISKLKKNDTLQVKVWFKDRPLAKAKVEATYAGFKQKSQHYAFQGATDGQGVAAVKLVNAGPQIIIVEHKTPYPDRGICDDMLYKYTFTFNLP